MSREDSSLPSSLLLITLAKQGGRRAAFDVAPWPFFEALYAELALFGV